MLKFITLSLLATLGIFGLSFQFSTKFDESKPRKYEAQYVWIMIIDGPRFTETFGDSTHKYIPNLANTLAKEGTLFMNFRNNGPTYTNAGHTAITTGHYQSISNAGKELPKKPGMFQYFLKNRMVDKSDAYIVSSKGKLEILANTKNKTWWNTFMPSTYCGKLGLASEYINDEQTHNKLKTLIGENAPHLLLSNYLAVDTYAHSNQWDNYLASIQKCDEFALDLWSSIQKNPTMRNKTMLIITNDHGRHLNGHKDGFVNHGDNCEGCRKIFMLALGPDVKKNNVITSEAEQIDISKTIAEILHFEMPTSEGRILNELFK
jgi:hypothetical protein